MRVVTEPVLLALASDANLLSFSVALSQSPSPLEKKYTKIKTQDPLLITTHKRVYLASYQTNIRYQVAKDLKEHQKNKITNPPR